MSEKHRVTPRELLFDLVFVFVFTQVATRSERGTSRETTSGLAR